MIWQGLAAKRREGDKSGEHQGAFAVEVGAEAVELDRGNDLPSMAGMRNTFSGFSRDRRTNAISGERAEPASEVKRITTLTMSHLYVSSKNAKRFSGCVTDKQARASGISSELRLSFSHRQRKDAVDWNAPIIQNRLRPMPILPISESR